MTALVSKVNPPQQSKNGGVYQIRDTMHPKWVKRVDILKTPGTKQFKYDNITLTKYESDVDANLALTPSHVDIVLPFLSQLAINN